MAKKKLTPPSLPTVHVVDETTDALTINKLQETGVKISLNQNDLIEVMVDDLYTDLFQEVTVFLKGINQDDYNAQVQKEIEIFKKECLKKYPFITKENLDFRCFENHSYNDSKYKDKVEKVSMIGRKYDTNSGFSLSDKNINKVSLYTVTTIKFTAKKDHLFFELHKEVDLQKYNKSDVLEYSKRVDDFYEKINMLLGDKRPQTLSDFQFTPNNIHKLLRTRMNKKLIKAQSPEVAEMLNKLFNTKF